MFIRELPPTYKNVLILLGGLALFWVLYNISAVIAPFLVSIVFAYILNPIIRFLEKLRIPRPWGVLTLYIVAILTGILIVVPITLTIVSEANDLVGRLSNIDVQKSTADLKLQAKTLLQNFSRLPMVQNYLDISLNTDRVQEIAAKAAIILKDVVVQIVRNTLGFAMKAFSGVVGLFFIPLLTFYLLVDLDLFYQNMTLLVPPVYRNSFVRIATDIDEVLSGFLRGQLIACLIFGSLMTLGLWLTGLHFFLVLGPMAGVANMVPYLGGLCTIIMSTGVALSQHGFSHALLFALLKIGIVLAIVQAIDGFVLQPQVIGENAGLHPLVVMFALVLGGSLYGILGMVLSVPVTCILKVVSRELYHELYDPT
jgi:predicted PurR-regulated permease PerM